MVTRLTILRLSKSFGDKSPTSVAPHCYLSNLAVTLSSVERGLIGPSDKDGWCGFREFCKAMI